MNKLMNIAKLHFFYQVQLCILPETNSGQDIDRTVAQLYFSWSLQQGRRDSTYCIKDCIQFSGGHMIFFTLLAWLAHADTHKISMNYAFKCVIRFQRAHGGWLSLSCTYTLDWGQKALNPENQLHCTSS